VGLQVELQLEQKHQHVIRIKKKKVEVFAYTKLLDNAMQQNKRSGAKLFFKL
jgi:hypothetical protein